MGERLSARPTVWPDDDRRLLDVDAYRDHVLDQVEPLEPATLDLAEAFGCAVIDAVRASSSLPRFASSAMDGFAVRAADVTDASPEQPTSLRLTGSVRMGEMPVGEVEGGTAFAVSTGAAIPGGADAVVPIEWCVADRGCVLVVHGVDRGTYVRPAGADVREGDVLMTSGPLRAAGLGLLASAGVRRVHVRPRARVGVVSTGDELVAPGERLVGAKIYDANASLLMGALQEAGAVPVEGGIVGDDPVALVDALDRLVPHVDAVVCSGGVSQGEHDPVKRAFSDGGAVAFHEVAMQPGKPQAFGTYLGKPFFGLPGNPVSVFVSFEMFVRPALGRMMSLALDRPEVMAVLDASIEGLERKTRFARVMVRAEDGSFAASPCEGHGSNLIGTLTRGNGLAFVPPGSGLAAGDRCRVLLFGDWT